jgi:hypothetical protein
MRGEQNSQIELLTTTSPGKRVPATHPIREIKRLADQALAKLDPVFDASFRAPRSDGATRRRATVRPTVLGRVSSRQAARVAAATR